MSAVFGPISNSYGEQIAVSCTLNNGLRVQIREGQGNWECFDFDTAEQAELIADQLLKAAVIYRAEIEQ